MDSMPLTFAGLAAASLALFRAARRLRSSLATPPSSSSASTPRSLLLELDSLTVYNIVDNESDGMSGGCACCQGDDATFEYTSEMDSHIAATKSLNFDTLCHAAHGLSLLLVGTRDGVTHTCLFDGGPNAAVFRENVEKLRLGTALGDVENVVLSHYHIDHSGGLRSAIPAIAARREEHGRRPVVIDLHPDNPLSRGVRTQTGSYMTFQPEGPTFTELEAMGAELAISREGHLISDGCFYVSGEIPRTTAFETGMDNHWSKRARDHVSGVGSDDGGVWEKDGTIDDERYLCAKIKGKGIVVFSACSHAGIVNVVNDAVRKTGTPEVLGILGGLHLAPYAQDDARLTSTIEGLKRHRPTTIVAGHCTGWRAKMMLATAFPEGFQPAAVGGRYDFAAEGYDDEGGGRSAQGFGH